MKGEIVMANSRLTAILKRDEELAKIRQEKYLSQRDRYSLMEAQIAFIKELTKDIQEAKKLKEDPEKYVEDHHIVFSPEVVEMVLDATLVDIEFTDPVKEKLGMHALKDLVDMKEIAVTGTNANLAAVAAFAAVVSAVCAVVTLVRTSKPVAMVALENTNLTHVKDIILPNGVKFIERDFTK